MLNRYLHVKLLLLALFCLGSVVTARADSCSGTLLGHTRWSGKMEMAGMVTVPVGVTLTLEAGSRIQVATAEAKLIVRGRLLIEGTAANPVSFVTPPGWQGIELMETQEKSSLRNARFSSAAAAISSYASNFEVIDSEFVDCEFGVRLLRESAPLIEGNRFVGGGIGVANEMRSNPTIRNNYFEKLTQTGVLASHNSRGRISGNQFIGNKQGVGLQQPYPDMVDNNLFRSNELGLFCNQTKNTPEVVDNRFEENDNALVNYSFAYPLVRNNVFVRNKTAIRNDQYGSPKVENNLLENNGTALHNYRKSNPQVSHNLFSHNELAMFCDYSSYPQVRENNFIANQQGVKLGIYQSADWEKRSGSKRMVMQEAQARGSKNSMLEGAPTEFVDQVDVSGNWWGEDTPRLAGAGADANDPHFWDRHDQPTVVYEGFGDGAYALDLIIFSPPLAAPVTEVGPEAKP